MTNKWQFWIDRGGTFTDIVAITPEGNVISRKYLSQNPESYKDSAIFGMRDILGVKPDAPFPEGLVSAIKMGTTVATNALLEREGEPTLLLTTSGFRDALFIGDQRRKKLFALQVENHIPLYKSVVEVDERVRASGDIISPLPFKVCKDQLQKEYGKGTRAIAIVFMHAYLYPKHEEQAAAIARDIGFTQISTSHQTVPLRKFIPRGDTTVADAYLTPILKSYVEMVSSEVGNTPLFFMQSNGGLAEAHHFKGKDAILSGPAGGIVGAARTTIDAGLSPIVGFDMGGTSTDVSHFEEHFERVFENEIAGVKLKVPMMDIHTVAAGGGSVCTFGQGRYRVGPESAGANPGPAAYGRGGPITVTDCNLWLKRISSDHFPQVFGASGKEPLNRMATKTKLTLIQKDIIKETGEDISLDKVARGFLDVANEHMSRAIKKISVERGHNITKHTLTSFGGAGGQHALGVAELLGIKQVYIHPLAGVLSALGIGLAVITEIKEMPINLTLTKPVLDKVKYFCRCLSREAVSAIQDQGVKGGSVHVRHNLHLKYQGSDTTLLIPFDNTMGLRGDFEAEHKRLFGFIEAGKSIIIEAAQVEAFGDTPKTPNFKAQLANNLDTLPKTEMCVGGSWTKIPLYRRDDMEFEKEVFGPALIIEDLGTNVLEKGWSLKKDKNGGLLFKRVEEVKEKGEVTHLDPILLEVFNNRFMGIAEEMGAILEKTAHSVNMKERLDFSCAIFDEGGSLVANAPHMPVHLGSMGESVRVAASRNKGQLEEGDVIMINDPYNGGTHLPDVTVVTPVFIKGIFEPQFFVASRGHHADIGGISPGSMPPHSKILDEEGVLFDNVSLVKNGEFLEKDVLHLLTSAKYPARNPAQNIADLKAQVASLEKGVSDVKKMVNEFGFETTKAYMQFVQENAESSVRAVIDLLEEGEVSFPMDGGAIIHVKITPDKKTRSATIDFSGSSPQMASNINAPKAITMAAILYVFRTLVDDEIPLNAGCLKPLNIIVPKGCFLNPTPPAAVVAGNVETSQAITNALFLALGTLASSQGTMNNLTFGTEDYQYYETICGGNGAGLGINGGHTTQVHMTNSKMTDPEVFEARYPVLLREHSRRYGSGGDGEWSGGDGSCRKIEFLEDMDLALLSNHRISGPPGLHGGKVGQVGMNTLFKKDGSKLLLKGSDATPVKAGDVIEILTPGGGGYGKTLGKDER